MKEDKKLPVYKLRVSADDDSPLTVDYVALVDSPAIELNWLAFDKRIKFTADAERKIVMGPAMIANMPIYRRDEKFGEYYVVFEKEEIYKIQEKFFRNKLTSNFNLMHGEGLKTENVYLVASFFVDKQMGIHPPDAFKDVSDGSWFIAVKIDDDVLWNEFIKTGQLKGFSIEGLFSYEKVDEQSQDLLEEIIDIVKGG